MKSDYIEPFLDKRCKNNKELIQEMKKHQKHNPAATPENALPIRYNEVNEQYRSKR
jgi:hypothetical protein